MIRARYRSAFAALAAAFLCLAAGTAAAQTLDRAAFYGAWAGSGIAENADSLYFGATVRDFEVRIGPDGSGFFVEWTSVIRGGGDPSNPNVRRKTVKVAFDPSGRPGVYKARTSGDPMSEDGYVWARLKDRMLTVNLMVVSDDGGYDVQTFDRELGAAGMELRFVRVRDGQVVREVKGRLIKTGN